MEIKSNMKKTYLRKLPDGRFAESRLSAIHRYQSTIKPLEDFIKWCNIYQIEGKE